MHSRMTRKSRWVTDNVVTGGYILRKGTAEPRPLEQIDYPVIKITTLSMSAQANANVDAANPGASGDQKAGMMTESGLTYGKNASVNETADRLFQRREHRRVCGQL